MAPHIMISYNWDIQDLVKKVAEGLKKRGIPVWMDLDAMSGDINSRYIFFISTEGKTLNCANILRTRASLVYKNSDCFTDLNFINKDYGLKVVCPDHVRTQRHFNVHTTSFQRLWTL